MFFKADDISKQIEFQMLEHRVHLLEIRCGSSLSALSATEQRLYDRLDNIEHVLELLMRRDGLQRVRVTEEVYQDLRTIITEAREELRKVKVTKQGA